MLGVAVAIPAESRGRCRVRMRRLSRLERPAEDDTFVNVIIEDMDVTLGSTMSLSEAPNELGSKLFAPNIIRKLISKTWSTRMIYETEESHSGLAKQH